MRWTYPRHICLCELALALARKMLRLGGDFRMNIFHGEGFAAYLTEVQGDLGKRVMCKPSASRDRSREQYLLGRGFKGN